MILKCVTHVYFKHALIYLKYFSYVASSCAYVFLNVCAWFFWSHVVPDNTVAPIFAGGGVRGSIFLVLEMVAMIPSGIQVL